MPTVPMYRPTAADLSWRDLFYPGGEEYFELEIEFSELRLLMQIGNGNPYNKKYADQYRKFMHRPTRYAPPMPADYPFALLRVNAMERLRSFARITSQKDPHPGPPPVYQGRGKSGVVPAQFLNEMGERTVAGPSPIAIGPARIALIEGNLQSDWRDEDVAMSFNGQLLSEIHNNALPEERWEQAEVAGEIKLSWSNLKLDQNISAKFSHVMRWGEKKLVVGAAFSAASSRGG